VIANFQRITQQAVFEKNNLNLADGGVKGI
jgi:hypothetical protein